jgi:hypothetical protein
MPNKTHRTVEYKLLDLLDSDKIRKVSYLREFMSSRRITKRTETTHHPANIDEGSFQERTHDIQYWRGEQEISRQQFEEELLNAFRATIRSM